MADVMWEAAPESVIHTAQQLVKEYHTELEDARIAFVMRSEPQKRGKRIIRGAACKIPQKMKTLFDFDFLIWLSNDDYTGATSALQEAMIDHELTHCSVSSRTGDWTIREHDVQEFSSVVRRHGLYTDDLFEFGKAKDDYQQGSLFSRLDRIEVTGGGRITTLTGEQFGKLSQRVGAS